MCFKISRRGEGLGTLATFVGLFLEKGKISKTEGHTDASIETPLCI
jgi:hypothetical protein